MTVETAAVTGTRVEWAPVPRVNLLPPEILERRRFVKVQRRLGAAVVVTIMACVGGTWWAAQGVGDARSDLDAAEATGQSLATEKARYNEVPKVIAQVKAVRDTRAKAMSADILWYRVLNDLALSTPHSIWLTSVQFTVADANAAAPAAASADPLSPTRVGSVTLGGKATGLEALAGWVEVLDNTAPMHDTVIASAQEVQTPPVVAPHMVEFTGSTVLTPEALSHRYDAKAE
jgi:Tfp pilus assembly protein PilN